MQINICKQPNENETKLGAVVVTSIDYYLIVILEEKNILQCL